MTDATTENAPFAFVRRENLEQQPAPLSVAGPITWIRSNLFSGPLSTILTLLCLYLVVVTVPGMVRFYLIDAVWAGANRDACLADKIGRPVGACWAYVADRFQYFIYGSYPIPQRWRLNIVFSMFALSVVWLLWNRAPLKKLGFFFFFVLLPISAFILLLGGPTAKSFLRYLLIAALALAALYVVLSFVPSLARLWTGPALLAVEEEAPPWKRFYRPKRLILMALVCFAIIALLNDKVGLPRVDTGLWGGTMVTFLVSAVGIVFSAIRIGAWAASGALNSIRIAKGKAAETKTRKKATYRGRHILLKRPSNLTAKQAFALDGMLANDADLREAYEAKERFFQIWDAPDRGSAEMVIDEWMETVPPQHRAAFKHAITALEDWREEVLTYWGEFPEISNAYTEAANGMAKIHNRKGRGYKFEVIRARVLIDMRTVTPTDFVKCHGCGIGFAAGMLVAQEAVSIGRGRRKVHLTLCPNCMVRNQSGMMKLKHQPTLKSE